MTDAGSASPNARTRTSQASAGGDASWGWSPDLIKAQAYEQILLGIILGELAPGERLDEQALAARYSWWRQYGDMDVYRLRSMPKA